MKIFGFEIGKKKAQALSGVDGRNGHWATIFDSYPGAWQQDVAVNTAEVMTYHAVFSCITLISNDIGKLRNKLMRKTSNVWTETSDPRISKLLKRPNRYQNQIQFRENWITSKLYRGNTYVLKQRDARGNVVALYILDPDRVTPLVSDDGEVYYQLSDDILAQIDGVITVPAPEIIHDRMNCLYHPLVGLSPIYANGLAAVQGLSMQKNSSRLFSNMSRPSGILVAPGSISKETADALKAGWDANYSGSNYGKTAVIGDGLKYEKLSVTAEEAQFIEQLKWTSEVVCSCFHVPAFKIGLGVMPTYQNAEMLNQDYYSTCLQSLIEQYEACMDEGLGLDESPAEMGVELDLDGLLRMDTATQVKTLSEAVKGSIMTIDEAREKRDLGKVTGGNTIWMQQQNYSLEALMERDASNPFEKPEPAPEPEDEQAQTEKMLTILNMKSPETLCNLM